MSCFRRPCVCPAGSRRQDRHSPQMFQRKATPTAVIYNTIIPRRSPTFISEKRRVNACYNVISDTLCTSIRNHQVSSSSSWEPPLRIPELQPWLFFTILRITPRRCDPRSRDLLSSRISCSRGRCHLSSALSQCHELPPFLRALTMRITPLPQTATPIHPMMSFPQAHTHS